jgi:phospholipase A-2-activating protein
MILYVVFDMVLSTVRRWRNGKVVGILEGHDGPVQAVLSLPGGEVMTGSSDMTMKLWRGSICISTIRGHTG